MPKVTDAHVEARRNQILEAACKCFSKKGFHKATIRDICSEAGLSAGAVYGYFKSKDEILEALAELGKRSTRALFDSSRTQEGAVRSLCNLIAKFNEYFNSEDGATGARLDLQLWTEALTTPRVGKLFEGAYANILEPFDEMVREGQKRGEIQPEIDSEGAARALIAFALGMGVLKALDPETSMAKTTEALAAMISGHFATSRS